MNNNRTVLGSTAQNIARTLLVAVVVLAGSAFAQEQTDLKFKDAIGVIPVTGIAANGAINLNVVRGINPGALWRIAGFSAQVRSDGRITIFGRGLLLASGNGIGTNAGQKVHATLFCGPALTATAHNTTVTGVALEPNGDFRIDDFLSPIQPVTCDSPVLLIRNVGGVWFAVGIQKLHDDKDITDKDDNYL